MNISKFVFYTLTTSALFLSTPLPLKAEITVTNSTLDEIEVTFRISATLGYKKGTPKKVDFDRFGGVNTHEYLTETIKPKGTWTITQGDVIPNGQDLTNYKSYFVDLQNVKVAKLEEGRAGFVTFSPFKYLHHFNLDEDKKQADQSKKFRIERSYPGYKVLPND